MLAPLLSADHYAFNPHAVPLFITAAITLLLGILTIAREKVRAPHRLSPF